MIKENFKSCYEEDWIVSKLESSNYLHIKMAMISALNITAAAFTIECLHNQAFADYYIHTKMYFYSLQFKYFQWRLVIVIWTKRNFQCTCQASFFNSRPKQQFING